MRSKKRMLLSAVFTLQILFIVTTPAAPAAETDLRSAVSNDSTWYTIQVSSYRDAGDADTRVTNLKARGLDAASSLEEVEGKGMWYRVSVGRYGTKSEAEAAAGSLKAEGVISGYWIRVLKDPGILPSASKQAPAVQEKEVPVIMEEAGATVPEGPAESVAAAIEGPAVAAQDTPQVPEVMEEAADSPRETVAAASEEGLTDAPGPEPVAGEIRPDTSGHSATEEKRTVEEEMPLATLKQTGNAQGSAKGQERHESGPEADRAGVSALSPSEGKKENRAKEFRSPGSAGGSDYDRFSVGLKLGGAYFPGLDDFEISNSTTIYYFKQKYMTMAITPCFYFNRSFSLEANIEKTMNSDFDLLYASLGPRWRFMERERKGIFSLTPYLRAALSWGDMSWDEAPGSFDSGMGGEIGAGLEAIKLRSGLKLGLETSYRTMKFGYNIPSGQGVTSTQDEIDFSGLSLTGFLNISF